MKISEIKVGDRLENYRTGRTYVITELAPCGSCACGNGEVHFDERCAKPGGDAAGFRPGEITTRRRCMTFRQFERLRFLRREDRPDPPAPGALHQSRT